MALQRIGCQSRRKFFRVWCQLETRKDIKFENFCVQTSCCSHCAVFFVLIKIQLETFPLYLEPCVYYPNLIFKYTKETISFFNDVPRTELLFYYLTADSYVTEGGQEKNFVCGESKERFHQNEMNYLKSCQFQFFIVI